MSMFMGALPIELIDYADDISLDDLAVILSVELSSASHTVPVPVDLVSSRVADSILSTTASTIVIPITLAAVPVGRTGKASAPDPLNALALSCTSSAATRSPASCGIRASIHAPDSKRAVNATAPSSAKELKKSKPHNPLAPAGSATKGAPSGAEVDFVEQYFGKLYGHGRSSGTSASIHAPSASQNRSYPSSLGHPIYTPSSISAITDDLHGMTAKMPAETKADFAAEASAPASAPADGEVAVVDVDIVTKKFSCFSLSDRPSIPGDCLFQRSICWSIHAPKSSIARDELPKTSSKEGKELTERFGETKLVHACKHTGTPGIAASIRLLSTTLGEQSTLEGLSAPSTYVLEHASFTVEKDQPASVSTNTSSEAATMRQTAGKPSTSTNTLIRTGGENFLLDIADAYLDQLYDSATRGISSSMHAPFNANRFSASGLGASIHAPVASTLSSPYSRELPSSIHAPARSALASTPVTTSVTVRPVPPSPQTPSPPSGRSSGCYKSATFLSSISADFKRRASPQRPCVPPSSGPVRGPLRPTKLNPQLSRPPVRRTNLPMKVKNSGKENRDGTVHNGQGMTRNETRVATRRVCA
ncbi:hypothetical protein SCP_0101360 [Sparassis crispa]|uniref:Uncharacterized protein n=1 Tax=Sparassis crispa TaxID=139825 RepID=A0A401G528_9APHY|nr:hypothetical protein SCP_0101360 [Sparassis crispa]GBE77263.1 hypothetical protein SCP_0101360 [Sparassis crispa]